MSNNVFNNLVLEMNASNKVNVSLIKEGYNDFWFVNNCSFCSKSVHLSGSCEIQAGLESGYIPQDIANRLGLDESSDRIPKSCPEKKVVFQGEHEREPGLTAEKIMQRAEQYKRSEGEII
jgi:hypothetical protein